MSSERLQLLAGIAALEAQRTLLGDAVVEVAVAGLRGQLVALATAATATSEATLRQVTIVFVDIVGSTRLGQQLDPEDIHAVIVAGLRRSG